MDDHRKLICPGRKKEISAGLAAVIILLVLLLCAIFGYSLYMASVGRVTVVRLDPYADLDIQGADGYGQVSVQFDRDSFSEDLQNLISSKGSSLEEEEIRSLAENAADSVLFTYDVHSRTGEESTGISVNSEDSDASPAAAEDSDGPSAALEDPGTFPVASENSDAPPAAGISNGDTVFLHLSIGESAQSALRGQGLSFVFECEEISLEVKGLVEADPYDPFEDFSFLVSGLSGGGELAFSYSGPYPLQFSADPVQNLSNGDTVTVYVHLSDGYDLDRIVEEYHIMPVTFEKSFTVAGLLIDPAGIEDFSQEVIAFLSQKSRETALSFLQEEYLEDERLVSLEGEEMLFIRPYSSAETGFANCLIASYQVNYSNESGEELAYFYYIRVDDLRIRDPGEEDSGEGGDPVDADFHNAGHPRKPTALFGELFGEGEEVSVPGFLNFRTLAGFETIDQFRQRVIEPLQAYCEVGVLE